MQGRNNQVQPRRLPETDGAKVLPTSDQVGLLPLKHLPDGATWHTSGKQACYSFIDPGEMKG